MPEMNRVIIIGLDGVPYHLIKDLGDKGVMPEFKNLMEKGYFAKMESSIPEISSVAWSSIITGKNPGEHGIFGFSDVPPGTYRLSFPNFDNLKVPPFWLKCGRGESIIINVPSTFPVKPLNGVHISGFVSLDLERGVYPKSLIPTITALGYRIDVNSAKAYKSMDLFLNDLDETLKARIETYRLLWKGHRWEIFMLVFTGTDRLSHFLWDAYENATHKYHSVFLEYFQRIDGVVGEIADGLSEYDTLIILSDHGFELLEGEINVNFLLQEIGFLRLNPHSDRNFADIDFGTRAFALEPGRIYINSKGKYPRGSVEEKDYDVLVDALIDFFEQLELKGRKAVQKVYRKEEIYTGPYTDCGPDVIIIPNKGFHLKADLRAHEPIERGIITGKHTSHDAFLLIRSVLVRNSIPNNPSVHDICDIIEEVRGQSQNRGFRPMTRVR